MRSVSALFSQKRVKKRVGEKKGPHSFCVGVDIFGVKKGKKSLRWVKKNGIPANPHSFRKTTPLERVQELKRTSLNSGLNARRVRDAGLDPTNIPKVVHAQIHRRLLPTLGDHLRSVGS